MNPLQDQRGYTLVELVVAMTIFVLISVVVLGALVTVIRSSTKTSAQRQVQQDARYSIEEIARQARSASIDYQFYTQNAADPRCGFSSASSNATGALALVSSEANESGAPVSKRLVYFYDADSSHTPSHPAIYRYQNSVATLTPSCASIFGAPLDAASGPSKSKITASNVDVSPLTFYISPNQDPSTKTLCAAGDTDCNVARNTHPRVTILMTVQTIGSGVGAVKQSKTGLTTLQTTVGSRAYPVKTLLGQPST